MSQTLRLMGLAFAAADALVELDDRGVVRFALGAAPGAQSPLNEWIGAPLGVRLEPAAAARLSEALQTLTPGTRSEPIEIAARLGALRLRPGTLRLMALPDLAPAVSCAISWSGAAYARSDRPAPPLADAEGLMTLAAGVDAGASLRLAVVEAPGADADADVRAAIEATLQALSLNQGSAARLAADRYALLRDHDDRADVAEAVRAAGLASGVTLDVSAEDQTAPAGADRLCALRAMRVALQACIEHAGDGAAGLDFTGELARTLGDAEAFRATVRGRDFALAYQPIVELGSEAVHHFEALARFGPGQSPAEMIRLAEELNLIGDFDLAVAEKALVQMRKPGFGLARVAVNVSAASLADDRYVEQLMRMTAAAPQMRRRLLIEVTESATLTDPVGAATRLAALRAGGHHVCIDDFGAGAASFDYLHRLPADTVKIDGSFVRGAAGDARARTMIGQIVQLCGRLRLTTIAEMIEDRPTAEAMATLGVDMGQGWLFGRPGETPRVERPQPAAARRRGAVAGWG